MKIASFLMFLCLFTGCKENQKAEQRINELEMALAKAESDLVERQEMVDLPLVHLVYLDLKNDISDLNRAKLMNTIHELGNIPAVKNLELGNFENLEDPRALSDFEVVFQMEFKNKTAYEAYQVDPLHLALKTLAKDLLAGPPVTYDYTKLLDK